MPSTHILNNKTDLKRKRPDGSNDPKWINSDIIVQGWWQEISKQL